MTGLTNEQVQERIAEGKVNVNENPNTRTYKSIRKTVFLLLKIRISICKASG